MTTLKIIKPCFLYVIMVQLHFIALLYILHSILKNCMNLQKIHNISEHIRL